ncbi:MAG: hypothetical protein J4215_01140 [Candidatus Diapherotrites archaeon]|uniref:Uncharacterized protein n=1 Tax=Candidatus Iainarchaeum sp. TaxID=3101447 RepID=A0A8T4L6J9_9ARCH|nr:hypothetical protein [Candidatus Diapherotrites archaeon]
MTKGQWYTFDALLGLFILSSLVLLSPVPTASDPTEDSTQNKVHDLQVIWSKETRFDLEEMNSDLSIVFHHQAYELKVNHTTIRSNFFDPDKALFSSEIPFVSDTDEILRIRIRVNYD